MATTQFIYVRSENRAPVGCIAYEETAGGVVKFSYSVCAKQDMKKFTKELSRKISSSRMTDDSHVKTVKVENAKNRHVVVTWLSAHKQGEEVAE